jgi:predicted alpha/beta superfamily hydrolase
MSSPGRVSNRYMHLKTGQLLPLRIFLCVLIWIVWPVLPAFSDEQPYVVPEVKVHRIQSRFVDQEFEIRVAVPVNLADGDERFPVMYLTDSSTTILFQDAATIMQLGGDVPRFISVGIGYPVKHGLGGMSLRTRDLTPTVVENDDEPPMPIRGIPQPRGKANGGAPEFLRFIREELIPMIDANYPTIKGDRGFFGDSLGGLFALYALFNEPDTFNRYIIGSPSAWWDDEVILKQAEAFIASHDDLPARVYMAAGALEEVGAESVGFRMVTNMYRIEKMLQVAGLQGLDLQVHTFPDETHMTVVAMNYIRGLQAVYDKPALSFIMEYMMKQAQADTPATGSD